MYYLFFALNYLPETTGIAPFTAGLCEHLVQQGHQVYVITTFPHAPEWEVYPEYRGKFLQRERINGVTVLRTFTIIPKRPKKAIGRILYDTAYPAFAFFRGLGVPQYDLVYCITPPLQLGFVAWFYSRLRGVPFVLHIQDIVPDAALGTGMLDENSVAMRLGHLMERFVYEQAIAIGVLCDGFARNLIAKGVPSSKITLLPDWTDVDFIRPLDRMNRFRDRHGLTQEDFVVMYSGNFGFKQGLDTLIKAAKLLEEQPHIRIYMIGGGRCQEDLRRMAQELMLTNLRFLPLQPLEDLPEQLSAADVLVLTQKETVHDMVLPSKLLTYMAAGRPVVAAVNDESETARYICLASNGIIVEPENPQALADTLIRLTSSSEAARKMGQNGRRFAEENFASSRVLERFIAFLAHVGQGNKIL
jgi:colanic acid biosynthesis glycosyl transferase WcaI